MGPGNQTHLRGYNNVESGHIMQPSTTELELTVLASIGLQLNSVLLSRHFARHSTSTLELAVLTPFAQNLNSVGSYDISCS
jgi:hypothetical protein